MAPTCCSLEVLDEFKLVTYDGTELGSPKGSNKGTIGANLEGLFLGDRLGYLDGINIVTNDVNELEFSYGKVLGTTLGDMYGISIGIYVHRPNFNIFLIWSFLHH